MSTSSSRACGQTVLFSLVVALVIVLCAPVCRSIRAQGAGWSYPQPFFEVNPSGNVQSPTLITDRGGNLHLFLGAARTEEEPRALYYSRYVGGTWDEPVDVLLPPDGSSVWPFSAHLDDEQVVHIYWRGELGIWHSSAPLVDARHARAWREPEIIPTADTVRNFSVTRDDGGRWYVAYTNGGRDAVRLFRSDNGGTDWSGETVIYTDARSDSLLSDPGAVLSPGGELWVWWAELDPEGAGFGHRAAWVSRSSDRGKSWSVAEQVSSGYYAVSFRALDDWFIRTVVGGVGTGGRYVSFSADNGTTWSNPHNLSVGGDGMQSIDVAVDSTGVWHFVVQTGETFATATWDKRSWTPIEDIVPRETLAACCQSPGEVTENAVGAISEGSLFHVFFEQDDRTIWYTHRRVEAPYVAPVDLAASGLAEQRLPPATVPTQADTGQSTPAPWADGKDVPSLRSSVVQQPATWVPLVMGTSAALLLVCIWAACQVKRFHRWF